MKSNGQASLEVLLIIAGMMVVVVVVITALQNSNALMSSNLTITNAKSACSFITKRNLCITTNISDVSVPGSSCTGETVCCPATGPPYECCWDGAQALTKQCYLNPNATYSPGS